MKVQSLAFSRLASSASTASRMNLARPYVPHSASMRSSTSAGRRTCVALLPSGGRPMRADVVDTDMSGKLIKNDTDNVDRENDVVYINDTDNGGKAMADTNYEIALKAEAKKVTRCFHAYSPEQRANHAASHRLGHRQRASTGEFFYVHPAFPNTAFSTRGAAARAAVEASQ